METFKIEVPMMYGDHHVVEVRKILQALPGVEDIYASSAFQMVEVNYDPSAVSPEQLRTALDEAGYLGILEVPEETGAIAELAEGEEIFMRHTEAYTQTKNAISFVQQVPFNGRPLWPCPGMGTLQQAKEQNDA